MALTRRERKRLARPSTPFCSCSTVAGRCPNMPSAASSSRFRRTRITVQVPSTGGGDNGKESAANQGVAPPSRAAQASSRCGCPLNPSGTAKLRCAGPLRHPSPGPRALPRAALCPAHGPRQDRPAGHIPLGDPARLGHAPGMVRGGGLIPARDSAGAAAKTRRALAGEQFVEDDAERERHPAGREHRHRAGPEPQRRQPRALAPVVAHEAVEQIGRSDRRQRADELGTDQRGERRDSVPRRARADGPALGRRRRSCARA